MPTNILNNIDFNKIGEQFLFNPNAPLVFNSGFFLFLFVLFFIFYQFCARHTTLRVAYVALFSLYFYYKTCGEYFILLAFVSLLVYFFALKIHNTQDKIKRKRLLVASILANLSLLSYFKYTNFTIDTVNSLFSLNFQNADIFLLPGISFFIFQSLSYTIDVYRKEIEPIRSFMSLLFCISFFPHLVAGPIIRASVIAPQVDKDVYVTKSDFGQGVCLIISGLIKKAVIADYISLNFVDRVFDEPMRFSGVENLMAVYAYALQIYCDFSGYSDIAIGIALLMGIKLPQNFNAPYHATSITDFWRRWHISLSSWLRDYLYIPLGGNKHGSLRQYFNLMVTMLLGGLWHGASWKFVLWGATHGIALSVEKALKIPSFTERSLAHKIFGIFITFHIVCFCWIFFRTPTFEQGWQMITQIATNFNAHIFVQWVDGFTTVFAIMLFGYIVHAMPKSLDMAWENIISESPLVAKACFVVMTIALIMQVKSSEIQPFIYFQF